MLNFNQQLKQYQKKLQRYELQAKRGQARVLNDGARAIKNKVAKAVAGKTRVKQSLLKKQIFTQRAKSNQLRAGVKSYLRPVGVAKLLTRGQLLKAPRGTNKRGVRAAGRQFDGAFINRVKRTGRYQVFKRKGRERYPLAVINIKIAPSFSVYQLPLAARFMRDEFARRYQKELKFRMGR